MNRSQQDQQVHTHQHRAPNLQAAQQNQSTVQNDFLGQWMTGMESQMSALEVKLTQFMQQISAAQHNAAANQAQMNVWQAALQYPQVMNPLQANMMPHQAYQQGAQVANMGHPAQN